jgi:hypothetical protein
MASAIDAYLANRSEKDIGTEFQWRVKRNLISSIKSKTKESTGLALKSNAKAFYKNGLLDKITLYTPYYIYPILDFGFEGTKINGINMRLKAGRFLSDALENGKVIRDLADVIGQSRANDVLFRTNFGFDTELETSRRI